MPKAGKSQISDILLTGPRDPRYGSALMANFSPNFKFKICQKFKINQPKEINCYVLDDFCMANLKFLTDFKFKIRWETRSKKQFNFNAQKFEYSTIFCCCKLLLNCKQTNYLKKRVKKICYSGNYQINFLIEITGNACQGSSIIEY